MSSKVVGDDPDSCIPAPLKDFVFDLHDSARRSQDAAEQSSLYTGVFRELSTKYFAQSAWPSPESIAQECGNDPLFLALYLELTHRHLHSVTRIQVADRIDGWHIYRKLFDLLLSEVATEDDENDPPSSAGTSLYILPLWAFDILHEFVYQFQGFCQFRTQNAANAAKSTSTPGKTPSNHVMETLDLLSKNRDAWAVETVLFYLHRLIAVGSNSKNNSSPAYRHLAIFASITLCRLECLLGDYSASLNAYSKLKSLYNLPNDSEEIVNSVFAAKLSFAYHAGISYLMLRRYKDSTKILGDICATMQRGFKTGQLRKLPGSDQFLKLFDRMIALLAILTHICPTSFKLEDPLNRIIRDKHSSQLTKIEAGEEGYEEIFMFSCPKFISPSVPDYASVMMNNNQTSEPGSTTTGNNSTTNTGTSTSTTNHAGQDAYRLQINQFMLEMSQQQSIRKLRSYMKLYTSIGVSKLAGFNDTAEEEFLARLVCCKHKMMQLEVTNDTAATDGSSNSNGTEMEEPVVVAAALQDDKLSAALDIHYHIVGDMVHVDEAEKQRRFENYFMKGIQTNSEIIKDVESIETKV